MLNISLWQLHPSPLGLVLLMLNSCKMVQKQSEAFHMFLWYFFQVLNTILLHIVLLMGQIAFLKFTSCDNQALVGCILIAAVAVHLNLKSLETYRMHLVICSDIVSSILI